MARLGLALVNQEIEKSPIKNRQSMNSDALRRYCLSFPQARENLQWRDELCFKVRGKIFMMVGLDSLPQRLCFKCTPEAFSELIERDGVIPAPYVGRYKWVMVKDPAALRDSELEDLIRQSYAMVAAKAPKKNARQKAHKKTPSRSRKPRAEI
jgi:predicted DNA-binding protein (MmcQ/YjbR family)